MSEASPEKFPAGPFVFAPDTDWDADTQQAYTEALSNVPQNLIAAVERFDEQQLERKYNNWTVRQIVHHLADSHLNGYVRTKWALTEASPLIKAYNESAWSELVDAKEFELDASLGIFAGIHQRWSELIRRLDERQMNRTYFHPEMGREVRLVESIANYIWHAAHHTAQIDWVWDNRGD